MFRKLLIAAGILLVIVGVIAGIKVAQIRSMIAAGESFVLPPEAVSSARVQRVDWEVTDQAIGSVTPVQGVLVRAEVGGLVARIAFESGSVVREGQVLVELDASSERAQLASAEARSELARANLTRVRDLHAQAILPKSELDAKEAAVLETKGEEDAIRVAIAKKVIRAPFAGRVGIRQVQLGQLAEPGTPIVTLQSIDPVHVDFSLPEQAAAVVHEGMKVRVTSDATPGRVFEGVLTAIDPEVDPASRNIRLQATFGDTGGALLAGMFARVELLRDQRITPLVIPLTSVLRAPYGDSVFVLADVKDEKTGRVAKRAAMTTVRLGASRGDLVVVESGLEEGQVIASSGVFKLSNGTEVVINDELAPSAVAAPNPTQS